MPIIKQIKLIDKKEFAKMALDKNIKAFMVYVTSLKLSLILIYLAKKAQIALLFIKKVMIPAKYSDFSDIFLDEKTLMLPKLTKLN